MTSALMPKIARPDGPVLGMRRSYRTGGKFVGGGMSCNKAREGDQCHGSSALRGEMRLSCRPTAYKWSVLRSHRGWGCLFQSTMDCWA